MDTIHFFAKESELPIQTKPYGALSATQYRVTSLFNGCLTANEPIAYAVTKGLVFIVDQTGNSDRVNLLLQPENLPYGAPVKYFIYRGLLKSDFLDKNNSYKTIKKAGTDDSNLITSIRRGKDGINALNLYSNKVDSDFIDFIFLKDEYQFAYVNQGDSLGRFDTLASTLDYGFEIMLDEYFFSPTFKLARCSTNIIEVSTDPEEADVSRLQILNYIDPAAYYGLFSHNAYSVGTNNTSTPLTVSKADMYKLVNKFITKNTVYIDIRDVYDHPMDWYDDSPQTLKYTTDGSSALSAVDANYRDSDGFPLKTVSLGFSNSQTNDNGQLYFTLKLSFSTVNNTTPLLTLHAGYWLKFVDKIDEDMLYSICTDNSGWTDDKEFAIYGAVDTNNIPVATYLRLKLSKYGDISVFNNQIPDILIDREVPIEGTAEGVDVVSILDLDYHWSFPEIGVAEYEEFTIASNS